MTGLRTVVDLITFYSLWSTEHKDVEFAVEGSKAEVEPIKSVSAKTEVRMPSLRDCSRCGERSDYKKE